MRVPRGALEALHFSPSPAKGHGLTSSAPRTTQEALKLRAGDGPTHYGPDRHRLPGRLPANSLLPRVNTPPMRMTGKFRNISSERYEKHPAKGGAYGRHACKRGYILGKIGPRNRGPIEIEKYEDALHMPNITWCADLKKKQRCACVTVENYEKLNGI